MHGCSCDDKDVSSSHGPAPAPSNEPTLFPGVHSGKGSHQAHGQAPAHSELLFAGQSASLLVPGDLAPSRLPAGKCAAAGALSISPLRLAEMHSDAQILITDALQATCWLACSAGPQSWACSLGRRCVLSSSWTVSASASSRSPLVQSCASLSCGALSARSEGGHGAAAVWRTGVATACM